jgi:hypothetical protein
MLTIKGVYRDGKVELLERPPELAAEVPVLVTFLPPGPAGEERPSPSPSDAARARREAGERLLAQFEKGIDFGGPPYPKREELYDRVQRFIDRLEQDDNRRSLDP